MNSFIEKIETFHPLTATETRIKERFIDFISHNPDCFLRSNLQGHITASAFVVDKAADKILLIHHKKLDKWLQPGGHCDGDTDTLAVAIKEVWEETGVVVQAGNQSIADLDIHVIPKRKDIPEHEHFDVRYIFEADSLLPLIQNHETNDLKWISLDDLSRYTDEESVLRVTRRI